MFRKLFYTTLCLGYFAMTGTANSTVITDSAAGDDTWSYIHFDHNGGALEIDMWANGFTGGPNQGINDGYFFLFEDDGSNIGALTGTFIDYDDDDNAFEGNDGSTSTLDSYLNFANLDLGSYILAIGNCCFGGNPTDARANTNSHITTEFRDYQVTFSPDVQVTAVNGVATTVAEPAPLALLGLGLFGVAALRNRRRS